MEVVVSINNNNMPCERLQSVLAVSYLKRYLTQSGRLEEESYQWITVSLPVIPREGGVP